MYQGSLELATPKTPVIRKTKDYKKFKFLKFNRRLWVPTLRRLIKLTKEQDRMRLFPILVDKSFNIIDGQHRFETCKELKIPVWYIMTDVKNATWKDINDMNTAGKRHNISELILLKARNSNNSELKKIYDIWKPYENTPLLMSTVANIAYQAHHSGKTLAAIKDDTFEIKHGDKLMAILSFIDDLRADEFVDWGRNKFIFAVLSIASAYKLDLNDFLKTITRNKTLLRKRNSKEEYIEHLITVYDHNRVKDRLRPKMK